MLSKIWAWFNDNKTIFGLVILAVLGQGYVPEGIFYDLLKWLGEILTGVGFAHKVYKTSKAE